MDFGAWEILQHPPFLDMYARHFGWSVLEHHGVHIIGRRLPGLGLVRAKAYSPEGGAGGNWHGALQDLPTGRVEVMTNARAPEWFGTPSSPPDLHSLVVDLRGGADAVFARFEPRTRRAIYRGEKAGLAVRATDDRQDVARLYELLMRASGGGVHYEVTHLSLLEAILRTGFGRLYVIVFRGKIVGGTFQLVHRYSHGYLGTFDRQACDGLPGNLLYWGVMQGEIAAGIPFLDLGAQSLSLQPGLTLAKRSYSPYMLPAYRYEFTPSRWRAALDDAWRSFKRSVSPALPRPTMATEEPG